MNQQLSVFSGAFSYEFQMQVRRPTMWTAMILVELLMLGIMFRIPVFTQILGQLNHYPVLTEVVYWADLMNYVIPIAFGILLADRLQRDRRTRVDEILTATPSSHTTRLFGKFLGSTAATLLPILLFYVIGLGVIAAKTGNYLVFPLAIEAFAAIVLPGLLFVGACSVMLPAFIWVPLYQVCFVGYWFWGNLYKTRVIPTLSNTIFTPAGGYMSLGFFGLSIFPVAHATPMEGIESLLILLVLAILVVLGVSSLQQWQQARM
jgi:ABC-2 type transport system permease protein